MVGEALGQTEADMGLPFQGRAGETLGDALNRAGVARPSLSIANIIWCQPPNNKLLGQAYTAQAIDHCTRQHLDKFLREIHPQVIVPLGDIAFGYFSGGEHGILEARGYPFWSQQYGCLVLPSIHPSYIQRGNFAEEALLIHDLQHAQEISEGGYQPRWGHYLLDPDLQAAHAWLAQYQHASWCSADIETKRKKKKEDESDLGEVDGDTITRVSFSFEDYSGISLVANATNWPLIKQILASSIPKIFWNAPFDVPRLEAVGAKVNGEIHDGMVAFHVLNSDVPKDLGTVATLMCPDQPRWKHLSHVRPAFYNAVDADVALRATLAVYEKLKVLGLWPMYQRHIVQFRQVTQKMSRRGMPIDLERRRQYAQELDDSLRKNTQQAEQMVPWEIRPKKVYKKRPSVCSACGLANPRKDHTKTFTRKVNPCAGAEIFFQEPTVKYLPMKLSRKLVLAYQEFMSHPRIMHGKGEDRKATTDATALRTLLLTHPEDPIYPLILTHRKLDKLRGTYIGRLEGGCVVGGLKVGPDGMVHTMFTDTPSTLRTATENPNMQNIPRGKGTWERMVKGMFVAPPGMAFMARDYSGIEAVLVGYFANDREYTRLALMDVHSFVTAYAMYELGKKITYEDLPQLGWSDADLSAALAQIKHQWRAQRQGTKHLVHASNYLAKAKMAQEILFDELEIVLPLKEIRRFQAFYAELFPAIPRWQHHLAKQVDGLEKPEAHPLLGLTVEDSHVVNPYGYLHRFYHVLRWKRLFNGTWEWELGEGAKALVAFPPQSTAAGIGKEAIMRLDTNYPAIASGLRLFVHDELLGLWPSDMQDDIMDTLKEVMEAPIPELPLPPAWNMGTHLAIRSEGKVGTCWAEMHNAD